MKFIFTLCFSLLIGFYAGAQNLHWIELSDKDERVKFNPFTFFDAKTIERRVLQNLPLIDWYDLPLNPNYLKALVLNDIQPLSESRWLNSVTAQLSDEQISWLRSQSFVKSIHRVETLPILCAYEGADSTRILNNSGLGIQTRLLGLEQWSEANLNGKGIRICVADVGFQNVDKSPVFEKLRKQGQIIKTYDFIKKDTNVYLGGWHGTAVLACIAGNHESTPLGLAEGAEFLLARTEYDKKERFAEEQFWVQAMEWAEKNGADIVNSSLGYSTPRYTTDQMNGKSTFITRAANIAAKKGLLVINAAGNEGNDEWKTIIAPADADSVLTIGGVTSSGIHVSFSSFGPTLDLRLKPNLVAPGNVYAPTPYKVSSTSGTSFSTPLVSGFAACAWQKNRTLKNMELFKELEKSGQLYPYFDYAHGYGIPQAAYFLSNSKSDSSYQTIVLNINSENESAEIEITDSQNVNRKLLYYHVANTNNKLIAYYTYSLQENEGNNTKMVIMLPKQLIKKGNTIRVCRAGEFIEKTIE